MPYQECLTHWSEQLLCINPCACLIWAAQLRGCSVNWNLTALPLTPHPCQGKNIWPDREGNVQFKCSGWAQRLCALVPTLTHARRGNAWSEQLLWMVLWTVIHNGCGSCHTLFFWKTRNGTSPFLCYTQPAPSADASPVEIHRRDLWRRLRMHFWSISCCVTTQRQQKLKVQLSHLSFPWSKEYINE